MTHAISGDYGNLRSSNTYDRWAQYLENFANKVKTKDNTGVHTSRVAQDLRDAISGSHSTAAGRTTND